MSELRSPSPASCGRSLDGWSDHSAARWGQALADHLPMFWKKQVKSNVFSIINSLPHYLCYKCNCPFKAFSNKFLCAWSVASVCVWFSWEMGFCTMPGIRFQQLSNSWVTQHLPHLKVCQHQTTSECACCVYVYTHETERWTEMLVYPSAFIVMFLRTLMTFANTLLKCRSPECAYSLRDANTVHHAYHYSWLECFHDFYWKNRLYKWKSRKRKLGGEKALWF